MNCLLNTFLNKDEEGDAERQNPRRMFGRHAMLIHAWTKYKNTLRILTVDIEKSRCNYLLSPKHTHYSGLRADTERVGVRVPNT